MLLYEKYFKSLNKKEKNKRFLDILDLKYKDLDFNQKLEVKQDLLILQEGKCAICEEEMENIRKAHLDHCHKRGNIRGLLCAKCNYGLGNFKDNKDIMIKAINYITSIYVKIEERVL